MKLGRNASVDDRARELWDLFADEIANASSLQLMSLMQAFQNDPDWSAAPHWARTAFRRIAERIGE